MISCMEKDYKRTSLYANHQKLNARIIQFAGWEMPVWYSGIIQEHLCVRNNVGIFDVSHMGEFYFEGPGALAFLNSMVTNDLSKVKDLQGQYNLLHTEDGGIVDDLIVYRVDEQHWFTVVNAGNIDKDWGWFQKFLPTDGSVTAINRSNDYSLFALQGPKVFNVLSDLGVTEAESMKPFRILDTKIYNNPVRIMSTGYTGEKGVEIMVANDIAPFMWDKIIEVGHSNEIMPIGLGARDTLRLEVCYSLYGHELDDTTSAWEAGLDWVVKMNKDKFNGKEFLAKQKETGINRKIGGFKIDKKYGAARQGAKIYDTNSKEIGYVTSGAYAPMLDESVALGYMPPELVTPGTQLFVDLRGDKFKVTTCELPFYKK